MPSRPYPSDLSYDEWRLLEPLFPPRHRGRRPKWPRRLLADAIFHVVRSGCAWRMLPRDHPPSRSDPPEGCRTVPAYVGRTRGPAGTKLRTSEEAVLGTEVRVFGNVAARGATEDEADVNRGVEVLLLVEDEGAWRIASRAWDTEGPSKRAPERLVGGAALD